MLTQKQFELLRFICRRLDKTGISPSFDEMKTALGLSSKSGAHRLVSALEERGFIRRLANRARAIEVLRRPDEMISSRFPAQNSGFYPHLVQSNLHPNTSPPEEKADGMQSGYDPVKVTVVGRIAAGLPVEAIENDLRSIPIDRQLIGPGQHFALEIRGDSMIEAGILDGDTAILRRTMEAESGDIVVALIDEQEATLKRLRKKGDAIALEAANSAYETQIYGSSRVRIQGRLVALLRQYQ